MGNDDSGNENYDEAELQAALDALMEDPKYKGKVIVLPPGKKKNKKEEG